MGCRWQQVGDMAVLGQHGSHLCMLASLHEGTDWVEGTSAAGIQVGPVVGMEDLHKVHALGLEAEGIGRQCWEWLPGTPPGLSRHPQKLTVMSLPAQLHSSLHSTGAGQ